MTIRLHSRSSFSIMILLLTMLLVACGPTPAPQGNNSSNPQAPANRSSGQKTITVGISGTIEALSIMGSSTTSGGWQSLNELHSQGLITSDRDQQRPVPRLVTQVPTFD